MIARRALLRWAGLGATNLLGLGCATAGRASTDPDEWEEPSRVAFTLFVKPRGFTDVAARQGRSPGTFEPVLTDSVRERLLAEVPASLQPIAQHPLQHFHSLEEHYALDLLVAPELGRSPAVASTVQEGRVELASDFKVKVPGYFVRVSIEKHYIGGCVKRDTWHAGVLLRDLSSNTLLFDLHIASWWEQKRPCFALYESASGFCQNVCDQPGWDALVALIYAVLATAMIAWLAEVIASAIAAAVLGVLIIIPGVPPPP